MYKLIRSKVPEKLIEQGKSIETLTINTDWLYIEMLKNSLKESCDTVLQSNSLGALIDLQDIINCILSVNGISKEDFEKSCKQAEEDVGSFSGRLVGLFSDNLASVPEATQNQEKESADK
mgnify:CR=1 FL=1